MTAAPDLTPEQFIIEYIVDHADERGEVASRACIAAAEEAGFAERATVKARHRARSKIGTRKAGWRFDGVPGTGSGWVWYLMFDARRDQLAQALSEDSAWGYSKNPFSGPA